MASSAPRFENLPNDLLEQIFVRLTECQSIIRCGSVSKRWRSIITGDFRLEHIFNLRCPETCTQIIGCGLIGSPLRRYFEWKTSLGSSSTTPLQEFSLDFLPWAWGENINVRGSATDLLLLSRRDAYMVESYDRDFLVCNPFTRQVVMLPRSPINRATRWSLLLDSTSCLSRGGCNCNIRFRAVLFSPVRGDGMRAAVFCSETGQWDEMAFRCPPQSDDTTINIGNVLHWLSGNGYIVSYSPFRLPGKRLGSMPLPHDCRTAPATDLLLGLVGGRLRLAQRIEEEIEGGPPRLFLRVWGRSVSEAWVLEHDEVALKPDDFVFAFNMFDGDRFFSLGVEEEEREISVRQHDMKEMSGFQRVGLLPPPDVNNPSEVEVDYHTLLHCPTPTTIPPLPTTPHSLLATLIKFLLPWFPVFPFITTFRYII